MSIINNPTALKTLRQRNYLARDFDGFRNVLLNYARQYYPERIQDFSEASVGGLFLDMAAYIGDNMSFYLDHLYNELNNETVVETVNIERALRNANVPIRGASASTVFVDFFVEIPVVNDGSLRPDPKLLPTILSNAILKADNGTTFVLVEDVNFWSTDEETGDTVIAKDVEVFSGRRINGNIISKVLKKKGICTSGSQAVESFNVGSFVPFRRISLTNSDITQIVSVSDALGNTYYEVNSLSDDVVYKNVLNTINKNDLVKDSLKVIPAPYRFTTQTSLADRRTTLIFGGGNANNLEDDIIPDPSEFSIPLPYSQSFSRIPINPNKMLQTNTLGVSAENTSIRVAYRYGGGLSHNVQPGSIKTIEYLQTKFPENPTPGQQSQVTSTIQVSNSDFAIGGEDALTSDELLQLIPSMKNSQERIVTKEDLISRVYTMPSNFGRVFRAMIAKNPRNPLSSVLYVISRDQTNQLIPSSDALKINLKRYLESYRMISDAIDIVDARVIDLELQFEVVLDPTLNKSSVLQSILSDLIRQFDIKRFHIGQPIVISDVIATIFSRQGVIAVNRIKFNNLHGEVKNLTYSNIEFDVDAYTKNQIIYPLEGAIFQIRYPNLNIIGKAVS